MGVRVAPRDRSGVYSLSRLRGKLILEVDEFQAPLNL